MTAQITWEWKRFADLAPAELYAVLAARSEVFVVEQRCAFLDADGVDPLAWHLLGRTSDDQRALATYLRLVEPGYKFAEASIGRVLTTRPFRRTGLGRSAMWEGLRFANQTYPDCGVRIAAQCYLERFYAGLGFVRASDPYDEDGIAHIDMLYAILQTSSTP